MKKTAATLLSFTLLSALPVSAAERSNADPYRPYNRFVFNINDKADHYVLAPAICDYREVMPEPVCAGVSNSFNNLRGVASFDSNALRLDTKHASGDFVRAGINTASGLGRLIDVAGAGGIPNNKNALGDTLALWGWKNNNHSVVPLLGPSTVHDTTGSITTTAYPIKSTVFHTLAGRWSATRLNAVNNREGLLNLTGSLEGAALDKYNYTRGLYMQTRARQTGSALPQIPDDDIDIDELMDSGRPDNLSPAEAADMPRAASTPVAEKWVHIRPEGSSNAGQVQQRGPLLKYSEAV